MTEVIVERDFGAPLTREDIEGVLKSSSGCFNDWQVTWHDSYQCGALMFCHFSAPDVESVRIALRQSGTECNAKVYPITTHLAKNKLAINVMVTRELPESTEFETLQQQEESNSACLDMHDVTFIKTFFSLDKKKMLCLYNAPDLEAVRIAQRAAKMPVTNVYTCKELLPKHFLSV